MKKIELKKLTFFVVSVALIISSSCQICPQETSSSFGSEYYLFSKVDNSVSLGENAASYVFEQIEDEMVDSLPVHHVNLNYEEYLSIVDSFLVKALNEDLADWEIKGFSFSNDCTNIEYGFSGSTFWIIKQEGQLFRITVSEKIIVIDPNSNSIEYYPKSFGKFLFRDPEIKLENILVPPDKAFSIVEKHGGGDIRKNSDFKCTVNIYGDTETSKDFWEIHYISSYTGLILLDSSVNFSNGKYEVSN